MNFGERIRFFLLNDDDSDLLGKYGEDLTARKLKWTKLFGYSGMLLRNVYIPAEIGETTEIDLIYITQKGLFIIESKNYSGWIFGSESGRYWTQSMPDRTKHQFFNPIWQNRGHIKWLKAFLQDESLPCFSLIVFSERCELKKLTFYDENCKIIHRDEMFLTIRSIWKRHPDALTEEQVKSIYDSLSVLQNADDALKQAHIDRIQNAYGSRKRAPEQPAVQTQPASALPPEQPLPPEPPQTVQPVPAETEPEPQPAKPEESQRKCPRCGAALVLRIAKKGENTGKQFYGCSSFPKCRYFVNAEEPAAKSVPECKPEPVPAPVATEKCIPEPQPQPPIQTGMQCPRCGAAMVLRTANKGANAGKQFYGCSAFPKCRFIQTVPEPVSDYRGALYLE